MVIMKNMQVASKEDKNKEDENMQDAQNQDAQNPVNRVEQMYEYGYRKSNYGPDELVTDAHGNPISVMDAMLSAQDASTAQTQTRYGTCCYASEF